MRQAGVKGYAGDMSMSGPAKSRREEYSEATRAALIEAARQIFAAEGYQQTGIEAIARAARVTRGAFYHHFADKRAIFDALVVDLQQRCAEEVVAHAQAHEDPWMRLLSGCAAFLDASADPAALGAARCREIGEAYPFGLMINALTALKAAGLLETDNPRLLGRMLGTMICEAALLMTDAPDPVELEQQAGTIIAQALSAFRI